MNKYFYDDIFISIELGRQSASTGRATIYSNGHIWNRCCPFSYSTSSSRRLSTIVDEVVLGVVVYSPGTSSSEA